MSEKLTNLADANAVDIDGDYLYIVQYVNDATPYWTSRKIKPQDLNPDDFASLITQSSHGLAVGNVVRLSGTSYIKATADTAANAEVVGIVDSVPTVNTFWLRTGGKITGLSGLTAGTVYFLSAGTAGALTATEPTGSNISKPVLIADTTTSGYFFNMRGAQIADASSGSVVSLLARTNYIPATDQTYANTTSTSFVDVDATNLQVTAVVPASGSVRVTLTSLFTLTGASNVYWGLRVGTTDIATSSRFMTNVPTDAFQYYYEAILTGLTPGSTTFKWAWKTSTGSQILIYAGPGYGGSIMSVYDH